MLKGEEGALEQSEASNSTEKMIPSATEVTENKNVKVSEEDEGCSGNDDIVKNLREIKRQNFITHCLLSAMIVVTVTWQISEASLVLKVRDGLSHPFRAFGSLFTGMFKARNMNRRGSEDKDDQSDTSAMSALMTPNIPHVDISN